MGFIMEGLDAEDYDRTYGDRVLFVRVMAYFRPALPWMCLVAVTIVLGSVAGMLTPVLLSWGIDELLGTAANSVLIGLTAGVLAAGVLLWLFGFVRQIITARVVAGVVLKLRQDAFDAVMRRDMSFYDTNPTGKVVSRVTSDTDDFANVVSLTMNLISQLLLVLIITVLLFTRTV